MNKRLGSSYIEDENKVNISVVRGRKSLYASIAAAALALIVLFLTLQPFLMSAIGNNNGTTQNKTVSTSAQAGEPGIFCSTEFGLGMNGKSSWQGAMDILVYPDMGSREVTIQEALGHGVGFVNYDGEGEVKDKFATKPKKDPKPGKDVFGESEASFDELFKKNKSKFEKERDAGECITSYLITPFANLGMMTASGITKIAQFSAVMVFNGNLICPEPGEGGACLDLIGIIGGTGGSEEGIVGVLTSSIYFPLLVIAVAVTAFWVLKKGIIDRKIREALFGALWLCVSVILGLALLLNPLLITKAPMAVSNAVSTCVIGAFNGKNCFDSSGSNSISYEDGESTSEKVCRSSSDQASIDEQMTFTTSSITCSIWKAFVLEPYSQGSFGTSFNDLDVKANPELNKVLKDQKLDPNMYCVNLGTTKSLTSQKGKYLQLDSEKNKVCNLAAYQMYLKTKATTEGDKNVTNVDYKWYRVIMATVSDDGLWANWTAEGMGLNQLAVSGIALLAAGLGTFIIFITSLFALVYYISSVILMAFAPIFFLMGVHPGRGKSILLGWVEKVISNVLKYMASAVFLVVTISIYGGILGSIDNIGLTLLFVIIITMALFMYRGELIDLLGKANMGGERLSNKLTDKLGEKSSGAMKFASSTAIAGAGGVAGAAITSGNKPFSKGFGRDLRMGMQDGVKRETKRNPGFIGNVARQYDRNTVDNKQDLRAKAQNSEDAENRAQEDWNNKISNYDEAEKDRTNIKNQGEVDKIDLAELNSNHEQIKSAENGVLKDFSNKTEDDYNRQREAIQKQNLSPQETKLRIESLDKQRNDAHSFNELQGLLNGLRDDKIKVDIALRNGDHEEANRLKSGIADKNVRAEQLRSNISDINMRKFSRDYEKAMESKRDLGIISNFDKEMHDAIVGKQVAVDKYNETLDEASEKVKEASEEMIKAEEEYKINANARDEYEKKFIAMRPGEGLTDRGVNKLDKRLSKKNDKIAQEINDKSSEFQRQEEEENNNRENKVDKTFKPNTDPANRDGFGSHFEKNDVEVLNVPEGYSVSIPEEPKNKPTVGVSENIPDKPNHPPKPSHKPTVGGAGENIPDKPNHPPKPSQNPTIGSSDSNNSQSSNTPPKNSSGGGSSSRIPTSPAASGRRVADSVGVAESNSSTDSAYRKSQEEFEKQLQEKEDEYIAERRQKIKDSEQKVSKGNNKALRDVAKQREDMLKNGGNNNRNGSSTQNNNRDNNDPRNRRNNS